MSNPANDPTLSDKEKAIFAVLKLSDSDYLRDCAKNQIHIPDGLSETSLAIVKTLGEATADRLYEIADHIERLETALRGVVELGPEHCFQRPPHEEFVKRYNKAREALEDIEQ